MDFAGSLNQVTTLATSSAISAWAVVGSFVALLVLMLAFYLFSRYAGRGPFVAILLAFYAAYALYAAFPYADYLPSAPALTAVGVRIAIYIGLVLVFYIILRRVVVSDFLDLGLFGTLALSAFASAFLLALGYHVFSVTAVYQFPSSLAMLFAPKEYFFWWFVAPAIGLFFLAK
ncbi:MAG TPA: hypothetical protein VMT80_02730 [Candidatus Paceibacterota bacterium]|nr:hypothetical protein [Candidatus Paceibacterota bacterium]